MSIRVVTNGEATATVFVVLDIYGPKRVVELPRAGRVWIGLIESSICKAEEDVSE